VRQAPSNTVLKADHAPNLAAREPDMSKRLFDFVASALGLLLLAPLMLAIAGWIMYDSSCPVLFRQKRVGRAGVIFDILKFRSMAVGDKPGPLITVGDDARITRAGRFLRRH
jgi:lipopolysaccharide/colanic/teichoic acid biosynthesis glycosyltransferase